jgi:hypothetical protein
MIEGLHCDWLGGSAVLLKEDGLGVFALEEIEDRECVVNGCSQEQRFVELGDGAVGHSG